jgi:hypothetical protein
MMMPGSLAAMMLPLASTALHRYIPASPYTTFPTLSSLLPTAPSYEMVILGSSVETDIPSLSQVMEEGIGCWKVQLSVVGKFAKAVALAGESLKAG